MSKFQRYRQIEQEDIHMQFHKWQWKAWNSIARFLLFISGTQGGKTHLGTIWIQNQVEKDLKADYAVITPTYKILDQATLPKFMENRVIPGRWNEQKRSWQTGRGGNIFFRSAEEPDNIESMTLKAGWLDEAGRMKAKVFPVMQSRVGRYKGRLLMTTTPYANNWIFWQIYKPAKAGNPEYEVVEFPTVDNPWYPAEEVEAAKGRMSPDEFKRRMLGQFTVRKGLVYSEFERSIHVVNQQDLGSNCKRWGGIDFGYTKKHPTAYVGFVQDAEGKIYVEHVYRQSEGLLSDHAKAIKELTEDKHIRIWGDAAASQEIAELRNFGLNVAPATRKMSPETGCDRIARFLRTGQLFVMDKPQNYDLVDEFETYMYKDEEYSLNSKRSQVIKDKDDCLDALRYGLINEIYYAPEPEARPIPQAKPVPILNPVTGYPTGMWSTENNNDIFRMKYLYGRKNATQGNE